MTGPESLHNHTNISDGELTHLEFLAAAERQGVAVVGFTDHDILPDAATIQQLREYAGPVGWTIGIELSAGLPKEMEGWKQHSIHLLGLFVDPTNVALQEFCARIKEGRLSHMRRQVAHLVSLGFELTEDECIAAAGPGQLAQPHVVQALLAKPQNRELMARIKDEMKAVAAKDPVVQKAYADMIEKGERQEPYALVMGSRSFRPLAKADFAFIVDLDAGVKLIRDAGGIALIAHPYVYFDELDAMKMKELASDKRIDGLEVRLVNTFGGSAVWADSMKQLEQIAADTGCLALASCDGHDEADLAAFATSEVGKASVGQTADILDRQFFNLEWSRLG